MYGYIYKITNKINNKIYIGQHKSDHFDERYFGSGIVITNAMEKYGKDNFTREILDWCETKEELDNREIYWIQKLNSRNPEIGYNISEGGEHGLADCVKIIKGNDSMFIGKENIDLFLKDGWITVEEKNRRLLEYNKLVNEITDEIMKVSNNRYYKTRYYHNLPGIAKIEYAKRHK